MESIPSGFGIDSGNPVVHGHDRHYLRSGRCGDYHAAPVTRHYCGSQCRNDRNRTDYPSAGPEHGCQFFSESVQAVNACSCSPDHRNHCSDEGTQSSGKDSDRIRYSLFRSDEYDCRGRVPDRDRYYRETLLHTRAESLYRIPGCRVLPPRSVSCRHFRCRDSWPFPRSTRFW